MINSHKAKRVAPHSPLCSALMFYPAGAPVSTAAESHSCHMGSPSGAQQEQSFKLTTGTQATGCQRPGPRQSKCLQTYYGAYYAKQSMPHMEVAQCSNQELNGACGYACVVSAMHGLEKAASARSVKQQTPAAGLGLALHPAAAVCCCGSDGAARWVLPGAQALHKYAVHQAVEVWDINSVKVRPLHLLHVSAQPGPPYWPPF